MPLQTQKGCPFAPEQSLLKNMRISLVREAEAVMVSMVVIPERRMKGMSVDSLKECMVELDRRRRGDGGRYEDGEGCRSVCRAIYFKSRIADASGPHGLLRSSIFLPLEM